jgi:hypothetical protein
MSLFSGEQQYTIGGTNIDTAYITVQLKNAEGVTAANYTTFFIAPVPISILSVSEIHSTASSSGTLDITHDTGTGAPQSGSSIFASGTFNTAATANTLQTKNNITNGVLKAGDRLSLLNGGTLTSLANVAVVITYTVL